MKKWDIIAYADTERRLPRKEKVIYAKDWNEAISKGWDMFPEYKELGAFEKEDD